MIGQNIFCALFRYFAFSLNDSRQNSERRTLFSAPAFHPQATANTQRWLVLNVRLNNISLLPCCCIWCCKPQSPHFLGGKRVSAVFGEFHVLIVDSRLQVSQSNTECCCGLHSRSLQGSFEPWAARSSSSHCFFPEIRAARQRGAKDGSLRRLGGLLVRTF